MNATVLRTEELKAFYVLEEFGTQKIAKAVNEVNLDVQENEVYGIAGESGCGKTTLLKTLFGAIERPLRLIGGRIFYRMLDDEIDVTALGPEEKRRLRWEYISYVPQGSMSVLNPVSRVKTTYRDFIGSHVSGKTRDEALRVAGTQIVELGLPPNILDAYPHQLSGGMRQRVTIALAALLKPRIIIADEPTTALDVIVQDRVLRKLEEIQRRLDMALIYISHDIAVIAEVSDRIGVMYAGRMAELASSVEVFERPLHPYTYALIGAFPSIKGEKKALNTLPGEPPDLLSPPPGCRFHPRCFRALDVCREEQPAFRDHGGGHYAACWNPVEVD